MLEPSAAAVQEVQESKAPSNFEMTAPPTNPLVEAVPASIRKAEDEVSVTWGTQTFPEPTGFAEHVWSSFIESSRRDVHRSPHSARAYANLGLALVKAGRLEEAKVELQRALALDPVDYLAAMTLARLRLNQGAFEDAERLLARLVEHRPGDPNLLLGLAYLLILRSDQRGAADLLRRALQSDDQLSFARFLLGTIHLQGGNIPAAISEFKAATRTDIRIPALHHALGVAYAMAEDYIRAERSFRVALRLAPNWPRATRDLGKALLHQRRPGDAVDVLKHQLEKEPTDIETRELLARAYIDLRKFDLARSQLREVLRQLVPEEDKKRRSVALAEIAVTYFFEKNLKEAEASFLKAIEIDPHASSIMYENLGRLYLSRDEFDAALRVLFRSKSLFPQSQTTRLLISMAYARLDRFDEAIEELRPVLLSGRAGEDVYAALGSLYSWIGDYERALEVAKAGYGRFGRTPGMVNNLAYVYLQLGKVEDARVILHSLSRKAELTVPLVATQGLLRLWEGDVEAARRLYATAATKAGQEGNRDLSRKVRQKMHLELAKYFCRLRDFNSAKAEVRRGLAVHVKALPYTEHLMRVARQLGPLS